MENDSRAHPRKRSPRTTATVRVGGDVVHGTVLDTSPEGIFFRPDWAVVDSGFQSGAKPIERFRIDDEVEIELLRDGVASSAVGTVRWVGCNDLYFCHGAGLKVDRQPR